MCFHGGVIFKQQRLSDLIGPYRGTYRIVYRVLQPLLEASKFVFLLLVGELQQEQPPIPPVRQERAQADAQVRPWMKHQHTMGAHWRNGKSGKPAF